jgi:hypothetical protein
MRAAWLHRDDANPVVKVLLDHDADLDFVEGLESRDKARLRERIENSRRAPIQP